VALFVFCFGFYFLLLADYWTFVSPVACWSTCVWGAELTAIV